jgi:hypothetical protein
MSVFMMLQVEGAPSRLAEVMSDEGRFFASADGGTIAVFDEWESEEGCHTFFNASPEIPQLMQEAGVTSEPRIAFRRPLDTPDQF